MNLDVVNRVINFYSLGNYAGSKGLFWHPARVGRAPESLPEKPGEISFISDKLSAANSHRILCTGELTVVSRVWASPEKVDGCRSGDVRGRAEAGGAKRQKGGEEFLLLRVYDPWLCLISSHVTAVQLVFVMSGFLFLYCVVTSRGLHLY